MKVALRALGFEPSAKELRRQISELNKPSHGGGHGGGKESGSGMNRDKDDGKITLDFKDF